MIEKIGVKDFKSYIEAVLKLSPLTVLVGANASGKSNILEAIRFFNYLAQGYKLSSLQYMQNGNRVFRGRISELPRKGESKFSMSCTISGIEYSTLELELSLRENNELHIHLEEIRAPDQLGYNVLYRTTAPSEGANTQITVDYNNFARGGRKPQILCSDQMAIFLQMESAARFADSHIKAREIIPKVAKRFEDMLAGILFLDPVPQKMRDYSFLSEKKLLEDGSNLSSVLYHLWNATTSVYDIHTQNTDTSDKLKNDIRSSFLKDFKAEKERYPNRYILLEFIRSLPEQEIQEIDFLVGPRGEVMIQLVETFGKEKRKFNAGVLSDGTLRVLALAAALLSAKPGSMVIVEEVDNGVHPSRTDMLLKAIHQVAEQKELTILISTHNPALLDALPYEAIPGVVFCYRNPKTGWSELIQMADLASYPELVSQGALGELLTKGLIDRFVKNNPGVEEKQRQSLEWLESFR